MLDHSHSPRPAVHLRVALACPVWARVTRTGSSPSHHSTYDLDVWCTIDLSALPGSCQATEESSHSPGTPLSSWTPCSENSMPEPTTRSLTVRDTSTSPGPASPQTRAARCTHMPPMSLPITSHSPV